MEISLEGKVALVTGAGPNIGSGIALALSRYGAKVACNDVNPEAAAATAGRIEKHGGVASIVPGDVTREGDVTRYVKQVLDEWGRIDILINNAAILAGQGLLEENVEHFNRAVEVTGAGNFLNTKHVALSMIEREIRGSIISIVSSSGYQGVPGMIAYAFHKGGLFNFVRAAAMELAPYGIRVNSFTPTAPEPDNPDFVRSGGQPRPQPERPSWWRSPGTIDVRRNFPMGVPSTPTDIGHCVAWVCSDYARLITGCDFVVDGGARAKSFFLTPGEDVLGPVPVIPL